MKAHPWATAVSPAASARRRRGRQVGGRLHRQAGCSWLTARGKLAHKRLQAQHHLELPQQCHSASTAHLPTHPPHSQMGWISMQQLDAATLKPGTTKQVGRVALLPGVVV